MVKFLMAEMCRVTVTSLALLMIFSSPLISAAKDKLTIQLNAGGHHREQSLVSVALPESFNTNGQFSLTRLDTDAEVPCQLTAGKRPELSWILTSPLPAGQQRRYRLESVARTTGQQAVQVLHDGDTVRANLNANPHARWCPRHR